VDDGGTELTHRERAVLLELEQSLARGELAREHGPFASVGRWYVQRYVLGIAAAVVLAAAVSIIMQIGADLRTVTAAAALAAALNASVVLLGLLLAAGRHWTVNRRLRRLAAPDGRARRRPRRR
jgi:hypothetical protein